MASSCSSSPSSKSEFDIESLVKLLECPVHLIPLKTAVSCSPCMHKISESAAQVLYGTMEGGACSKPDQRCVVCRGIVRAYYADHTIRDLVNRILGVDVKKIMTELPTSSIVLEGKEEEQKELPYPGKPARFVHYRGDWTYFNHGEDTRLRYILGFKSVVVDSLVKGVDLAGYSDGEVHLSVKFEDDNKEFQKYLASFGILMKNLDVRLGSFTAQTPSELKQMFAIICKHNELPAELFAKMRAIVEKGTC